jgi:hypothetical protein
MAAAKVVDEQSKQKEQGKLIDNKYSTYSNS